MTRKISNRLSCAKILVESKLRTRICELCLLQRHFGKIRFPLRRQIFPASARIPTPQKATLDSREKSNFPGRENVSNGSNARDRGKLRHALPEQILRPPRG